MRCAGTAGTPGTSWWWGSGRPPPSWPLPPPSIRSGAGASWASCGSETIRASLPPAPPRRRGWAPSWAPYPPPEAWLRQVPDEGYEGGRELPISEDNSGYRSIPAYQAIDGITESLEYVRRYDAEIRYLDRHLGRLFACLDAEDTFARALVLLAADHGEAMGEDDFYFAHGNGHSLGSDQHRVPLAMVGPGIVEGTVIERPVSHVAVCSTILDFVNLAAPDDSDVASLPTLADATPAPLEIPLSFVSYLYRERKDDVGGANVLVCPATEAHPRPDHRARYIENLVGTPGSETGRVASRARLEDLLDAFEGRAAAARAKLAAHRKERAWSARSLERLRNLGLR